MNFAESTTVHFLEANDALWGVFVGGGGHDGEQMGDGGEVMKDMLLQLSLSNVDTWSLGNGHVTVESELKEWFSS